MNRKEHQSDNGVYVVSSENESGAVVNRRSVLLRNVPYKSGQGVLNGRESTSKPLLHIHANIANNPTPKPLKTHKPQIKPHGNQHGKQNKNEEETDPLTSIRGNAYGSSYLNIFGGTFSIRFRQH